jgi:hypothetical protein
LYTFEDETDVVARSSIDIALICCNIAHYNDTTIGKTLNSHSQQQRKSKSPYFPKGSH